VLNWIYDANISESAHSFKWLMLGFFSLSINFIFGTLLSANGNFKVLNYLAVVAVFFNVGLNFVFAPVYGSEGAAFIFFLTQTGVSLAQFILVKNIIGFKIIPVLILKHALVIISILLLGLYLSEGIELFIFQTLLGIVLLFALRIIDLRELKSSFLSSKETNNNN
jgi:O-antigen/teichoic acid export membrane protein